jgi:hypothetical protein
VLKYTRFSRCWRAGGRANPDPDFDFEPDFDFDFDFDFDPDFDFDFDYQLLFVGTIFKGAR